VSDARKKNHGKSLLMLHHEMQSAAAHVKLGHHAYIEFIEANFAWENDAVRLNGTT